jgi:hypothetical protein
VAVFDGEGKLALISRFDPATGVLQPEKVLGQPRNAASG